MSLRFILAFLLSLTASVLRGEEPLQAARPSIYTGVYQNGAFQSLTFLNSVTGWNTFFDAGFLGLGRVIANVEAGLIWSGHDVFLRPPGYAATVTTTFAGNGTIAEADFHATMVGHVLAGTGYVAGSSPEQFTYAGLGMAPLAEVWSGAIATSYSPTSTGTFETDAGSTIEVYRKFFQGIGGVKPDAINSSWGGDDPSATSPELLALDGLARQNPTVALVVSAGNSASAAISAPGSAYNNITVGSLGGPAFLTPSGFSSSGRVDFFNPVTGVTLRGVRSAVALAAPGENLVLAAYLGRTGSLGASTDPTISGFLQNSPSGGFYFVNQDGTSFAAPVVSGGIALLKDAAANDLIYNLNGNPNASDTRVIKSVLMAGATATWGWSNGQSPDAGGVVVTTQGVDDAAGAGALNLDKTVGIYLLSGTRDVAGTGGGELASSGWDFGSVSLGQSNDYPFANAFSGTVELTVSLNWFAGREFDDTSGTGGDSHFSDLNLEVWQVSGGSFSSLFAKSASIYNNTEFLRLDLPSGAYGLRVTFDGMVYETAPGSATTEIYGLAWHSLPVPEPPAAGLFLAAAAILWSAKIFCVRRGSFLSFSRVP